MAPIEHIAVYKNIAPWKVIAPVNDGRNFILTNAKIHISIIQNVTPALLMHCGMISTTTVMATDCKISKAKKKYCCEEKHKEVEDVQQICYLHAQRCHKHTPREC